MYGLKYIWSHIAKATYFFLGCEFFVRLFLLIDSSSSNHVRFLEILKIFGIGLVFDLTVLSFFLIPVALYLVCVPQHKKVSPFHRGMEQSIFAVFVFLILFTSMAEVIFWEEFSARFNFIAVDYLVYTHEVFRNIKESYNLPFLFGAIFLVLIVVVMLMRLLDKERVMPVPRWKLRMGLVAAVAITSGAFYTMAPQKVLSTLSSQIHREVAQNGIFSFFAAFFNNTLSYDQFYLTEKDLEQKGIESFKPTPCTQSESPRVQGHNVIFVLMESMSAEFMASFGNKDNLTPNLDRLAKESLFFTRLYATGTRTVRGIEALVLATPPSPGQSIVKRPENENLKSIGFAFKEQGYITRFIYGGNSYFDNMGYFFSHNEFDVVDSAHFGKEEISFENAWGMCDEDLFRKVISETDKAFAKKTPFMCIALTTSNHRPYTYPKGRIDLEPKVTGRAGGVKYADYAVGQLIEQAKAKPWFPHTVFVFIADHTHGTTGRLEVTPDKHHIPCLIYSPKLLKPKVIDILASQIDIPVTVMGILGIPFQSDFAVNILEKNPHRAFISNFQKLGYLEDETLTVLKPVKDFTLYQREVPVIDPSSYKEHLSKAVYYFGRASHWKENLRRGNKGGRD